MKEQIIDLLLTTNKSYRLIAQSVGCSQIYVRNLHKELLANIKDENNKRNTTGTNFGLSTTVR